MGLDIWNLMCLRYPAGTVLCTPKHTSPLFLITKPQTISLQKVYPGKFFPTRKRAPGHLLKPGYFHQDPLPSSPYGVKDIFLCVPAHKKSQDKSWRCSEGIKGASFLNNIRPIWWRRCQRCCVSRGLALKTEWALSSLHSKSLIGWRSRMYTNQPGMGRTSLFPMMLCT